MLSLETRYRRLCDHARQTALLASIESLLSWDEQTMLPPAGGEHRADQSSLVSGLIHQRWLDPQFADDLRTLAASPLAADESSDSGATLRELLREFEHRTRVPQRLVEELARAAVLGQQAWVVARRENRFSHFAPLLERLLALKREEAHALGYSDSPYDPLVDQYEPGETARGLRQLLAKLRDELVPLVQAIADSRRHPANSFLSREFPLDQQAQLAREAAQAIGFEFARGRLDVAPHPFCSGLGPHDCRLTTRYFPGDFRSALFSVLHEAGHGLYDQGLPAEHYGLPLGEAVSLGIHESQSRLWENLVGRSRAFWQWMLPRAQACFGAALADVTLDEIYFSVNDVRPSPIRVEADEATYNLHILVRFELEQDLIEDRLPLAELPEAWNAKYRQYVGIDPQSDADGVLQDVHWSAGLFGYFPTYTLGNLYAAQLIRQAGEDLGPLEPRLARGEFASLGAWLRETIHRQGQRFRARQLVERVTGRPLDHRDFMAYLRGKLGPLYGLDEGGRE